MRQRSSQVLSGLNTCDCFFENRHVGDAKVGALSGNAPAPPAPDCFDRQIGRPEPAILGVEQRLHDWEEGGRGPALGELAHVGRDPVEWEVAEDELALSLSFHSEAILGLPHLPRIGENDRVMGKPEAPIVIVECASFTCPRCARFTARCSRR